MAPPSGGSETFRGAGAWFSESETKAMKYLCATKEFLHSLELSCIWRLSDHSMGLSWQATEDSVQYLALANDLPSLINFRVGMTADSGLWSERGIRWLDVWCWGFKSKILAFTPGSWLRFWSGDDILTLNQSTQYMNFRAARCLAESAFDAQEISPRAIETDSLILQLQVQQLGVVNGTIAVNVTTDYSGLKSTSGESTYHIDPNEVKFIDLPFHFQSHLMLVTVSILRSPSVQVRMCRWSKPLRYSKAFRHSRKNVLR